MSTAGTAARVSVVVPVYNSAATMPVLVERLQRALEPLGAYEIILVNDGSRDGSLEEGRRLAAEHKAVRFLSFFRNFGQVSALMAGLREAEGELCLIMDDDLQHPPEEIPKLLAVMQQGFDYAFAISQDGDTHHGFARSLGSRLTRWVADRLVHKPRDLYYSSFMVMRRELVREVTRYQGPFPYLAGQIFRISHHGVNVPVRYDARKAGRSGYTLRRLLHHWLSSFTGFSVVPLRAASLLGTLTALGGFLVLSFIVARHLIWGYYLMGWTSLIGTVLLFAGIQLLALGVLGEYIGRSFMILNQAPQYCVRERHNCKEPPQGRADEPAPR